MTVRPCSRGGAPVPSMTRTLSSTSVRGWPPRADSTGSMPLTAAPRTRHRKRVRTSRIVVCRGLDRMPNVRFVRSAALAVVFVWALRTLTAAPETAVRVWEDSLELPTYAEGAPNPNPPFDFLSFTRFNYASQL